MSTAKLIFWNACHRPVAATRQAVAAVPGMRTSALQRHRGGAVLLISGVGPHGRVSRSVPVVDGRVSDIQVAGAIRDMLGANAVAHYGKALAG